MLRLHAVIPSIHILGRVLGKNLLQDFLLLILPDYLDLEVLLLLKILLLVLQEMLWVYSIPIFGDRLWDKLGGVLLGYLSVLELFSLYLQVLYQH